MGSKVPDRHARLDMQIVIEMVDGKRSSLSFCRNLSEGGMFLECVDAPAKGAVVKLEFTLPHNKTKLRVSGRVAWNSQERKASMTPGIGIKFEGLSPADMQGLSQAIAYLKGMKGAS